MNYKELAIRHLQDALTKGYIVLPDCPEEAVGVFSKLRELKPSEILAVAKYVLKEGLLQDTENGSIQSNIPSEMFLFGKEFVFNEGEE